MLEVQSQSKETIGPALEEATGKKPTWTVDKQGNGYGWLKLPAPARLADAAKALQSFNARLLTITAYSEKREDPEMRRSIGYHFALKGLHVTVSVPTYDRETGESIPIPSITPYFLNADWNEREFMEMYAIQIEGHPNPKRLFLDPRIDSGVMATLLPFSAVANGAAGRGLWEQVMLTKGVDISSHPLVAEPHLMPGTGLEVITYEPAVTPVAQTFPPLPKPKAGFVVEKAAEPLEASEEEQNG